MFLYLAASSTNNESSREQRDVATPLNTEPIETNSSSQTLKSERYVEYDEIESDSNVPESMQDFIYKKLSKVIDESIEFVEISTKMNKKRKSTRDEFGCVRLLKDTGPITKIGFEPTEPVNRKRCEIKRRIIEPDGYDEEKKLKMASIDGESILQPTETKSWKSKVKPNKVFNYREKKSVLYEVEARNEFTDLRKKNNWSEKKIANSPWKNHKKNL